MKNLEAANYIDWVLGQQVCTKCVSRGCETCKLRASIKQILDTFENNPQEEIETYIEPTFYN